MQSSRDMDPNATKLAEHWARLAENIQQNAIVRTIVGEWWVVIFQEFPKNAKNEDLWNTQTEIQEDTRKVGLPLRSL